MTESALPIRSPPVTADGTFTASVSGIVLAAGTSVRFGDENKLLQQIDGEPIIHRVVGTLLQTDLTGVGVVLGHEANAVRDALSELDVQILENEAFTSGQSSSVRAGVRYAARRESDAVLVALGDMPFVSSSSITSLLTAYETWESSALAAAYDGERGNPVIFDAQHFDALTKVGGDVGGREILLTADDAALVETNDPGVRRDVDDPTDLPGPDNS
ncbi:nucleotidyltransferase family protein [Halorarum salinum]|uniref:Nucleotidyltransferase family protein n=1 Tax=Halorarum salinum TaxID=2743089 RepID=A0A7D5L8R3_9EURY|nr:nucleotidyltransferase family protein [Halobaculum salinum]QLG60309.1 nucleotidyltransferase family protein [Halobaculum salinum]